MVSVDQLLDAREVGLRALVEGLREQAGQVAVELAEAELALERVVITKATLAAVLAEGSPTGASPQAVDVLAAAGAADGGGGVRRGSVPVWRAGMGGADLPVKFRPVWQAVVDAGGPLRAGQVAAALGWGTQRTVVEGLRYRLKRLAATGWLSELPSGAFAPGGPS